MISSSIGGTGIRSIPVFSSTNKMCFVMNNTNNYNSGSSSNNNNPRSNLNIAANGTTNINNNSGLLDSKFIRLKKQSLSIEHHLLFS
jgi:hypothetical protein